MTSRTDESLVGLGREVAENAARLAKAEIALARAQLLESLWKAAMGIGLVVVAAVLLPLFLAFVVATLDEGVRPEDSWPLYGAVAGLILASAFGGLAARTGRGWRALFGVLAVLGGVALVGLLVTFLVLAIIAAPPETGRRGWAISSAAIGLFAMVFGAAGGLILYRDLVATKRTVGSIKEDMAWVKRLTRRESSES